MIWFIPAAVNITTWQKKKQKENKISGNQVEQKMAGWNELSLRPRDNTRSFLKQGRRQRQRERHPKIALRVPVIISLLFKVVWLAKSLITMLELNWYERFDDYIWEKKQNENSSPSAYIVHRTAKLVISRRGENEDGWGTCKTEKRSCNASKTAVFHCLILYGCLVILWLSGRFSSVVIPDRQYHNLLLVSLLCNQIVILSYCWYNKVVVDVVVCKSGTSFSPSWLNTHPTICKEGTAKDSTTWAFTECCLTGLQSVGIRSRIHLILTKFPNHISTAKILGHNSQSLWSSGLDPRILKRKGKNCRIAKHKRADFCSHNAVEKRTLKKW